MKTFNNSRMTPIKFSILVLVGITAVLMVGCDEEKTPQPAETFRAPRSTPGQPKNTCGYGTHDYDHYKCNEDGTNRSRGAGSR
jgi:hypothetical protein